MLAEALSFLLETAVRLFVLAALARFLLQLFRAPYRNPLSVFVVALTDFAVRPLRRFVPGWHGLDLSSLVLAWALEFLLLVALASLLGSSPFPNGAMSVLGLLLLALVRLLRLCLYILIAAVFAQAILSWVNPFSPIMPVLDAITGPFLRPLRRRIPTVGNVDLTPLIFFVLCQLIIMLPVRWLEAAVHSLV